MKTSTTKRMLAFWLAVAILGAPASGALAAEMAIPQPTAQTSAEQAQAGDLNVTVAENHKLKTLIVGTQVTDIDVSSLVTVSGGTETYTYTVTGLPAGLSESDGKISGTPTTASSGQNITVTVTDSTPDKALEKSIEIPYDVVHPITLGALTQNITKMYDGTQNVEQEIPVTFSSAVTPSPTSPAPATSFVPPEKGTDYTVAAQFDSKDVGDSKRITVTVELTEVGKQKYIFAPASSSQQPATSTTATIENASITPAPLSKVDVPPITVAEKAGLDAVKKQLQNIKAIGVPIGSSSEEVTGTFDLTAATPRGSSVSVSAIDDFTQKSGSYTVTATFKPSNANYTEKTGIIFDCTVQSATPSFTANATASHNLKNLTVGSAVSDVEVKTLVTVSPDSADTYTYAIKGDLPAGLSESDGKISGTPTTAGTGTFTVTVTDKNTSTSQEVQISYTVNAQEITLNPATIKDGKVYDKNTDIDPKNIEVTFSGATPGPTRDIDYTVTGKFNDANAGENKEVTVTVTLTEAGQKKYTFAKSQISATTIVKNVAIKKAKYTADNVTENALAVAVSGNKGYTVYGQIPPAMMDLKPNCTVEVEKVKDTNSILNDTPAVDGNSVRIRIKPTATEKQTATIPVKLSFKNYEDVTITYTVTVVNKIDVSGNIQFADKTVVYNGSNQHLEKPTLTNVTASTNPKWTYAWTQNGVKPTADAADTTELPVFKDVGVYTVTATYEDDKYLGSKTAILKIEEAPAQNSSITVGAEQLGSGLDENYRNFTIETRDESNGYIRVRADANDYLDRQKIDDTYSEWIGLEITPKVSGRTVNVDTLYLSTNGSSWNKISRGAYGNFYLDGVSGSSFNLWYDTNDKDGSDDLYLATSNMGENKFRIRVDFDAYSTSSGSSSSGSTSSSTDKVNGDKVSTTTIDKTPSVKGNRATVSISSSALSDALEKNKKESKHEDSDKSFIELDVKTSKSVDDTTVTVPVKSLDKISDEDTGLSLVTNQGTIQLDYRALSKIVSAADKSEVSISIEEDKSNEYTLMIKDGSNKIIDLGSGEAELTFSYKLKSGEKASDVKVYRVGDGSKTWLSTYGGSTVYAGTGTYAAATGSYVTDMKADYNSSKKKVTFSTDALGTFLVTTDNLQTGGTSTPSTSYPSYPSSSTFVDVPASRWSAQYINKLASLGVINGTGGGYFEPTLYVSREEFVKMLAGVAGANVSGYTSQRFPDVSAYRWSAPYIAWAVDHGITAGTDGGKFAPTMKITREEMATMIYRYTQGAGKVLPVKNVPTTFGDAHRIESWAQTPVSVMQQAGIIDGNVTNGRYTFDPKVPATREECAKMLCILYDLI